MEFKIEQYAGTTIDKAMETLYSSAREIKHCLRENFVENWDDVVTISEFNGQVITSNDSLDEAYVKITGITKAEHDRYAQEQREEYQRKEREWEDSIPERVPAYCEMARDVIREDKYELWDEIVPIRLSDLYHGMELTATLEILKEWNESGSYKKCHDIILSQGHSGMSHGLVVAMVREFAKGENIDKLVAVLNEYEYKEYEA